MIKTAFEFNGLNVVAFGRSADGMNVQGLVVKFVDEDGQRIFPTVPEKQMDEILELAVEELNNEHFERELDFV